MRPEHKPNGDPCIYCNVPALEHRVYHVADSDPCVRCGLPSANHRVKSIEHWKRDNALSDNPQAERKSRKEINAAYRKSAKGKWAAKKAHIKRDEDQERIDDLEGARYLGIDGEGHGRSPHAYVFLGVSNIDGTVTYSIESNSWRDSWEEHAPNPHRPSGFGSYVRHVRSIPTLDALKFLLAFSPNARTFAYSFNYDLTKILEDVDNLPLFQLFRPETRPGIRKKFRQSFVEWGKYKLDLQGTKVTILGPAHHQRRVVWDIFKLYQSKLIDALIQWHVGSEDLHKRMGAMKSKRGEFEYEAPDDIEDYCLEECQCIGELTKKLVDSHHKVDLPLTKFFGPGSSATLMLKKMKIQEQIREPPKEMADAVAMAFFGGRFENSEIGVIEESIWNYDISSAYPYQMQFLPCLVHGTWRHTTDRADIDSGIALVHYRFADVDDAFLKKHCGAWGPFPFRMPKGTTCFPAISGGGWVYRDEYINGEKLFPHVRFHEAWVYETACDCQPFKQLAHYYLYRLWIGKDTSPGISVKLAINSCFGKLAQSVGAAEFNCWLWAGMITSGCRAQILDLMGRVPHLSDILMIATDGIASRKPIDCPPPRETNTTYLLGEDGAPPDPSKPNRKPLGGWEMTLNPKGIFLARPGVYFPLDPTEDEIKAIKARGIGKGTILQNFKLIVDAFLAGEMKIAVKDVPRFSGAKSSISRGGKPGKFIYTRADGGKGVNVPSYGNWILRTIEMSFNPMPKRKSIRKDGRTMKVRRLPLDIESLPYKKIKSPEALEMLAVKQENLEQPDEFWEDIGEQVEHDL